MLNDNDILKKSILELKESNRMKEAIIKLKYPALYQAALDRTSYLVDVKFNERLFHIINDLYDAPVCPSCNINTCEWFYDYFRYKQCCSHKCFLKCPDRFKKIKSTLESKFGGDSAFCDPKVREKSKATIKKRYGVESVMQVEKIKIKQRKSNEASTGFENNFLNPEILRAREESNLSKFGVKNVLAKGWKREEIAQGMVDKYGVDNNKKTLINESSRTLLEDERWLREMLVAKQLPLYEIAHQLDCDPTTVANWVKKFNIDISKNKQSFIETKLDSAISRVYEGKIIRHDRTTIPPLELDLLFPEHNLAVEVCGLYWHSNKFKDRDYHSIKRKACEYAGYKLITVYEDEVHYKFDIVLKSILHKLQCNYDKTVYARKTNIVEITKKQKKLFLDANHIQGNDNSTIAYGILYDNELVAVLSLQKQPEGYLISRYASKCKVIGGFSKMLKFVRTNYAGQKLWTFADLRWSDGGVYLKSGMTKTADVPISYDYIIKDKRFHKFNFRKKALLNRYPNKINEHMTERRMCEALNILKIYDCGKLKFSI